MMAYIALFYLSRADSLRSHVILHGRLAFYSGFEYPPQWCTYSAGIAADWVPRTLPGQHRRLAPTWLGRGNIRVF